MQLNLMMAGFWLALGVALLVYRWLHPEAKIGQIDAALAGAGAILLALWNIGRWLSSRTYVENPPTERLPQSRGRRRLDAEEEDYHPEFDFSRESKQINQELPSHNGNDAARLEPRRALARRKWERVGGLIGFLLGIAVELLISFKDLPDKSTEVLGKAIFAALVGAVLGAVGGAVLKRLVAERNE